MSNSTEALTLQADKNLVLYDGNRVKLMQAERN
jgi:hypothetical protein